jgi:tRNA splicing ligase
MPSRKNQRKTQRNRQSGGAPSDDDIRTALNSVLVHDYDYDRMVDNDSNSIDTTKSYDEFVEYNVNCALALSDTDRFVFMLMVKRVKAGKVKAMDMEYANGNKAYNMFFDKSKDFVFVMPR